MDKEIDVKQMINLFNLQGELVVAYRNYIAMTKKIETIESKLDLLLQKLDELRKPEIN